MEKMATKGKKKTPAKKKPQTTKTEYTAARRQLMSVIWFAIAVFFLCVVFIKGQNLWAMLHNLIFNI